jgi:hypothetical protein
MTCSRILAAVVALLVACHGWGVEIESTVSLLTIPKAQEVHLRRDTVIEVDSVQLDGILYTEGNSLRIDASQIAIGAFGSLQGYSLQNQPATPPKRARWLKAADPGPDAGTRPRWTFYKPEFEALSGKQGADGSVGEHGAAGAESPLPVFISVGRLELDGAIHLQGQNGGKGGTGQDGQTGGHGGRALDANCSSGATSVSCWPGDGYSGRGGLGGLGGTGGHGGDGGAAIPLVIVTYVPGPTLSTQSMSVPGARGPPGDPGSAGGIGDVGEGGRPCGAKARWGSWFGSCSNNGGQANPKNIADSRTSTNLGQEAPGDPGKLVNWPNVIGQLPIAAHRSLPETNVLSLSFDGKDLVIRIAREATLLELIGRYVLTLREGNNQFRLLHTPTEQARFAESFNREYRDIAAALGAISGSPDLERYFGSDEPAQFQQQLDLALPALRQDFSQHRQRLVQSCAELKNLAAATGIANPEAFYPRLFLFCYAQALNLLPFENPVESVRVRTPRANVPEELSEFYSENSSAISPVKAIVSLRVGHSHISEDAFGLTRLRAQSEITDTLKALRAGILRNGTLRFSLAPRTPSVLENADDLRQMIVAAQVLH